MLLTPVFLISLLISVAGAALYQRKQRQSLQALRRERVRVRRPGRGA
jgi:hypothetical protein